MVITGLETLINQEKWQKKIKGKIGLLCHSASIDSRFNHALSLFHKIYPSNLSKVFGPQHGLVTDVQDNMIETSHAEHPYYKIPVYSLYSETRRPTEEMLSGLETLVIDLQDVGTRIYTYITTLAYCMEECSRRGIKVIVLDRPNPINGKTIAGPVLQQNYRSFVGHHAIPVQHGLTIGEIALFTQKQFQLDLDLEVIPMQGWNRSMYFDQTGLPFVPPSPNIPSPTTCLTFPATVIFEGTLLSEGRGTTRPLEVVGHPNLAPHDFLDHLSPLLKEFDIRGCILRPGYIYPMFQKHSQTSCGAIHIEITDRDQFKSWRLGQLLCRELYYYLDSNFQWNNKEYEYEKDRLAIDLINGTDQLRHWVENRGSFKELNTIDLTDRSDFLNLADHCKLYS